MTPVSVAVVIPFRNGARWFPSIETSLRANWADLEEAIFVDDGSNDDSVDRFATHFGTEELRGKCRFIRLENNCGRSVARNVGARSAQATLIAFLDVDDEYHPGYLARLRHAFDNHPKTVHSYALPTFVSGSVVIGAQRADASQFEDGVIKGEFPYTSGIAVRREVFEQIGGFDESLEEREDWDLAIKLCTSYPGQFVLLPNGVNVRIHDTNHSRNPERFAKYTVQVARRAMNRAVLLRRRDLQSEVMLQVARVMFHRQVWSGSLNIAGFVSLSRAALLSPSKVVRSWRTLVAAVRRLSMFPRWIVKP